MESQNSELQDAIIGEIKRLRVQNDISQLQLSRILNISAGQIGNIESPKYQHKYTLKQIQTFCNYINYPLEQIFLTEEERASEDVISLLINKIIAYYE